MKKILFIIIFCLFTSTCFGALASTTVWEVRITGAATNSGGYVPGSSGTDFSQQDAAQYALTTATTVAANAIILDASAAADMVGNILYVVSGTNFIVGYYEIKSVVAGVRITVDRNCTTAAGALGVINIGGAVDHPQRLTGITNATDTVWIKKGVYQYLSGSYILDNSGGYIKKIIGYNATRGDDPTTVANMPQFDGETTNNDGIRSAGLIQNCAAYDNIYNGILVDGNLVINCIAYNNDIGIYATYGSAVNCIAYNNVNAGIYVENGSAVNCIAYNNTSIGVYSYVSLCLNCIAYNNDIGIQLDNSSTMNCVALNNITYGFYANPAYGFYYFDYNCYYGNGTDLSGITAGSHDVNADPLFVNAAGNDFTLQSTSPCISAGLSTLAGLTSDFVVNIGVDQSDHTATGGGGEHSFGSVN